MKSCRLIRTIVAVWLGYSASASAQDQGWLRDRRYQEGIGVRTGDLELHPGAAAELGYDSNYFLRSTKDPAGIVSAGRLRVTPSLALSTLSPQRREAEGATVPKVTLRANLAATYNDYLALQGSDSDALSGQRNVTGGVNVALGFLPQRPLGGDVYADLARSAQPSQNPDADYNRIAARFGGGLVWTPGGGMFDWRLGYEYAFTYFEQQQFRSLSTDQHSLNTRGRWRFLPRTSFLYDASLGFVRNINHPQGRLDSEPVRARIGINGLVSSSFAILAMAGWGSSFFRGGGITNAQQFDGVIGQAELRWFLVPSASSDPSGGGSPSSVAVGYSRDFVNSYVSDYFTNDRVYVNTSHFFGGRILLTVEGGVALHSYSTVYSASDRTQLSGPFKETRADATVFGEYRFSDSFGVNGTFRYSANLTDEQVSMPGASAGSVTYFDWNRFEGFVGLRWFL